MKIKELILQIRSIISDTLQPLHRRTKKSSGSNMDIEHLKMQISEIGEEQSIATHGEELLELYTLLAEAYVSIKVFRPLGQLSFEVRKVLRESDIPWEVIEETVPRFLDSLEYSVYHHEYYRLLLTFLAIAFKNNNLNADLKEYAEQLLKLRLLLRDIHDGQDNIPANEKQAADMDAAITSMFSSEELSDICHNPTLGRLRCDPVEYTLKWEEIYYDVEDYLSERFADVPRKMGFCHSYWSAKREYLKERYNIEWRSPKQMNPRVLFD
ncbi:MAG: hypothetical protein K2M07_05885 [Muribaculaceae bacterium]|nr:hypothetical protein [Muribaculaceae bacterium]